MKFEKVRVFNFEGAIRGMRNPKESWEKSDSRFGLTLGYAALETFHNMMKELFGKEPDNYLEYMYKNVFIYQDENGIKEYAALGPRDLELAQKLIRAGGEHRKFMRQIFVSVDITAPLYFWKEFDTYKVGTVSNSTSTMHKITSKPITLDCFETDDYDGDLIVFENEPYNYDDSMNECVINIIDMCETLRKRYIENKDKKYWKELIRWLPESWLQTRTITMNYENIYNMIHQRQNHKLTEWSIATIEFFKTLPYSEELLFI